MRFVYIYTVEKIDGATPKLVLVRGHDKPIHGSCTIYSPGGIYIYTSFLQITLDSMFALDLVCVVLEIYTLVCDLGKGAHNKVDWVQDIDWLTKTANLQS